MIQMEKIFLIWSIAALTVVLSCRPRAEQPTSGASAAVSDEEANSCLKNNSVHYQSWSVAEQTWTDGFCFQLGMDLCQFGPKWILMQKNFHIDQRDGRCEFMYGRPDLVSGISRLGGAKTFKCSKVVLVKPDRAQCENPGNPDTPAELAL